MSGAPQYLLAFFITLITAASIPALHISVLHIFQKPEKTVPWTFGCFLFSFVLWNALFFYTKDPIASALPALLSGYALLGFLWLGYMEMMFKIYRGFSHTLVTDVLRMQSATLTDITTNFAEGVGMDTMFDRRIETLKSTHFLTQQNDVLTLTSKGKNAARMGIFFKSFLKLGKGG